MNKKTLFLIFLSIYSIYTNGAIPPAKKRKIIAQPLLCEVLQQVDALTVSSVCRSCVCLRDAAMTINALAITNKFLNLYINDDTRTLQLIKNLSHQFDCCNMDVAKKLCTRAAKSRLVVQTAFLAEWSKGFKHIKTTINILKSMGLDLDFSYEKRHPTSLIQITSQYGAYSDLANWLIENGADINVCTSTGKNAFMIALDKGNIKIMNLLLCHPKLAVKYQDIKKNTPLHYCLHGLLNRTRYLLMCSDVYKIVKELLKKGADPTVINEDKKTPLDLAKEVEDQPLIKLLEKAEVEFKKANL